MKKFAILCLFSLFFVTTAFTQISKTINLTTAGTLSSLLTANEKSTVTNLTLTGNIDSRDFKTLRDNMPVLANIDLSGASIVAYTGTEGTNNENNINVIYPENEIPTYAFYNSVTYVGKTSLVTVLMPISTESIGGRAFMECSELTNFTIPTSVKSIGFDAFYGCRGLTNINIPSSVTSIESAAFAYCSGLTSITLPSSVTSIDDYTFVYCSGLTSIIIPSSVTTIGLSAFIECSGLTSITIPSSVTSIGDNAFMKCSELTSITIPSSVKSIGNNAFARCSGLTSITIPSSVTSIGNSAFFFCSGLTSITIPSSVTSIADDTFASCSGLTSITIPSSITSIGTWAFNGCSGLTSINIPSLVKSIGKYAFSYCNKLTEISVDSGNLYYSSLAGVLFNKNQTSLIQYPNGKIGNSYSIPPSVITIGDDAFSNSSWLTSITIPSSVTTINFNAFYNCGGLTSINIPSTVASIKNGAFGGCIGLKSIYVSKTYPISLSSSSGVFDNVNKTTCTLYVPVGSKSLYQTTVQWKDFTNIVEFTTATPSISEEVGIRVYPNPVVDNLTIEWLDGECKISVIDLNGRALIEKKMNAENLVSLGSLQRGQYLLRLNTSNGIKSLKILKQ